MCVIIVEEQELLYRQKVRSHTYSRDTVLCCIYVVTMSLYCIVVLKGGFRLIIVRVTFMYIR